LPTSGFTPFTEPEVVAAYLQPTLQRLAIAFSGACAQSSAMFIDRRWSPDAALAAYMVRKEVLEELRGENVEVEEEDIEVERKALCGLLLKFPLVHLKIRKSRDGEIPPAGSEQSSSFYNWNLLVFPQDNEDEPLPLHLLLLWNDSRRGELDSLTLVCVEGNDWRWRHAVFQRCSQDAAEPVNTQLAEAPSLEPSIDDFTEAFDAGNEDIPLRLANDPVAGDPTKAQIESNETEEQDISKKKAK
jgi:hypothetical protein